MDHHGKGEILRKYSLKPLLLPHYQISTPISSYNHLLHAPKALQQNFLDQQVQSRVCFTSKFEQSFTKAKRTSSSHSRHRLIDILHPGPLQKICWHVFRRLVLESPLPHLLEISALMPRVEIGVCCGLVLIPPHLTQDTDIDGAH